MRIALFEPDIPQNCGAVLRLCACMGVGLDLIEPFGFVWDEARVRRVALDYYDMAAPVRHRSWDAFVETRRPQRLVLLSTRGSLPYTGVSFMHDDILLFGRESAGVPETVFARTALQARIPMQGAARSMNVAMAASMVLGEALRQTASFP